MQTNEIKKQTVVYTFRLPVELHKQLEEAASSLNVGISAFLRMKLTEMLKNK